MTEPTARAVLLQGIVAANDQAARLLSVLESEFSALRGDDLPAFESLQPAKEELISALSRLVQRVAQVDDTPASPADSAEWLVLRQIMERCREAHRRNDVFIRTRLESIQAALRVLQAGEVAPGPDVYDRLGRIAGRAPGRGYTEA